MFDKSAQANSTAPSNTWVRSDELVQHPSGLIIMHNDELYRLRVTRKGKLILTK
ncbi:hemin uptake protein HemP [Marinobacterium stanieri]|uniref:Hemin uptake protein HemP n=1 Tax=Marinobacterium stanieri TaxID=49186 RepID=A0A1N6V634_9GAMM|nr:hemin uptake protein HemP [Marinobacterium stanieri]SIQ73300.1 Hemin uptake protein HemP [Marinobacterium stanieri]